MDETGLFYRTMPSKSISNEHIKGFEIFSIRIAIATTVHANGVKLKPFDTGLVARPRASFKLVVSSFVVYTYSTKSWMTSSTSNNSLEKLISENEIKK